MPDSTVDVGEAAGASDTATGRRWFVDHFETAASQTIAFVAGAGFTIEGADVADVGCGDGIIDLGLVTRGRPARLVGFDVVPTNTEYLLRQARRYGTADALPAELEFVRSEPTRLPAPDAAFDVVVSWSAFEHISDPASLLREIRRILRPDGAFFLQLWPFYYSQRGSHLWDWFPNGFHHLSQDDDQIAAEMRGSDRHAREWADYMLREYRALNRLTLDELQRHIVNAGLVVRRVQVITHQVDLSEELANVPISHLTTEGVMLLALPQGSTVTLAVPSQPLPAAASDDVGQALDRARGALEHWPPPRTLAGRLKRRLLRAEEDRLSRIAAALIDAIERGPR